MEGKHKLDLNYSEPEKEVIYYNQTNQPDQSQITIETKLFNQFINKEEILKANAKLWNPYLDYRLNEMVVIYNFDFYEISNQFHDFVIQPLRYFFNENELRKHWNFLYCCRKINFKPEETYYSNLKAKYNCEIKEQNFDDFKNRNSNEDNDNGFIVNKSNEIFDDSDFNGITREKVNNEYNNAKEEPKSYIQMLKDSIEKDKQNERKEEDNIPENTNNLSLNDLPEIEVVTKKTNKACSTNNFNNEISKNKDTGVILNIIEEEIDERKINVKPIIKEDDQKEINNKKENNEDNTQQDKPEINEHNKNNINNIHIANESNNKNKISNITNDDDFTNPIKRKELEKRIKEIEESSKQEIKIHSKKNKISNNTNQDIISKKKEDNNNSDSDDDFPINYKKQTAPKEEYSSITNSPTRNNIESHNDKSISNNNINSEFDSSIYNSKSFNEFIKENDKLNRDYENINKYFSFAMKGMSQLMPKIVSTQEKQVKDILVVKENNNSENDNIISEEEIKDKISKIENEETKFVIEASYKINKLVQDSVSV